MYSPHNNHDSTCNVTLAAGIANRFGFAIETETFSGKVNLHRMS